MSAKDNFLKTHYDKLVLAASVVFLAVSAFFAFVKGPADAARVRTDSDRDLKRLQDASGKSALEAALPHAHGVAMRIAGEPFRMAGTNVQFLVAPERVACASPTCLRPIPITADTCPVCGAEQPSDTVGDDWDSDGDGIPDSWEKKNGLNPLDASDADGDLDADGFSNKEEFDAGTDPRAAASHPPRFSFLRVVKVEAAAFPYVLRGKMLMPGGQYKFQINGPRGITHTIKTGDELDKTGFVLDSYTTRRGVVKRPGMPDRETDLYVLLFKRGPDEVELQEGREAVSSSYEVTFVCEKDKAAKEYTVKRNETFTFDGERFTLVDVRASAKAAALRRESTGELLQIRPL